MKCRKCKKCGHQLAECNDKDVCFKHQPGKDIIRHVYPFEWCTFNLFSGILISELQYNGRVNFEDY
jgi:hypothetical protein